MRTTPFSRQRTVCILRVPVARRISSHATFRPLSLAVPWEVKVLGTQGQPRQFIETNVVYTGERPSALGFFFQFKDIIFRWDGSVLGFIVIEVGIAFLLSFVALHTHPDEEYSHLGHQFVGVLLAFLTVFRTQNSHKLWAQGRICTGQMLSASRALANEILGCLVESTLANSSAGGAPARSRLGRAGWRDGSPSGDGIDGPPLLSLPPEAHETIRLLKLLYFVAVEHVRSSDGFEAWEFAQRVAYSHALPTEHAFMRAEFGPAQPGGGRRLVLPVDPPGEAVEWRPPRGTRASALRLENRYMLMDPRAGGARAIAGADVASPDGGTRVLPSGAGVGVSGTGARQPSRARIAGVNENEGGDARRPSSPSEPLLRPRLLGQKSRCVRGTSGMVGICTSSSSGAEEEGGGGGSGAPRAFEHNPHDPTRGKAQVVITWIRVLVSRVKHVAGAEQGTGRGRLDTRRAAEALDLMLEAFQGMHRVHSVYLPLPYCQLLKIIMCAPRRKADVPSCAVHRCPMRTLTSVQSLFFLGHVTLVLTNLTLTSVRSPRASRCDPLECTSLTRYASSLLFSSLLHPTRQVCMGLLPPLCDHQGDGRLPALYHLPGGPLLLWHRPGWCRARGPVRHRRQRPAVAPYGRFACG